MNKLFKEFKLKLFLLMLFSVLSFHSNASSAEWITHHTKGEIKLKEARYIEKTIYLLSIKHEIDPELIFRIIAVESRFKSKAISKHGAKGLMQIIPKYHKTKIQGRNIYDKYTNIDVGIQIYKEYKTKYKTRTKALRAYNGETKFNRYVNKINSINIYDVTEPYPGSNNLTGEYI